MAVLGPPLQSSYTAGAPSGDLCSLSLQPADSWHTGHCCLFRSSSSVQDIANNLAVEKCRRFGEEGVSFL